MWLRIRKIGEDSDALLLVIGRALAIAQNYERNARFVLRIAQMGKEYVEGRAETLAELIEFANSLLPEQVPASPLRVTVGRRAAPAFYLRPQELPPRPSIATRPTPSALFQVGREPRRGTSM
jgi:hypothetical protein